MRICQFRESRSCRVKSKIEDRSLNEMQKLVFDDCFWTTVNRTVVILEASICYVTFNKLQNVNVQQKLRRQLEEIPRAGSIR